MSDVRFKLKLRGLNELMKSGEMQSILNSAAVNLSRQAGGEGNKGVEFAHPVRFIAIASVHGTTKDNDLEKAMGGARI